jgi:hypothetical protein
MRESVCSEITESQTNIQIIKSYELLQLIHAFTVPSWRFLLYLVKSARMSFGICINPLIPLRADHSDKSEMTDQLLFGEVFRLLEEKNSWYLISRLSDNYKGWFNSRYFIRYTEDEVKNHQNSEQIVLSLPLNRVTLNKEQLMLPAGSILPFYNDRNDSFKIGNQTYHVHEKPESISLNKGDFVKRTALRFLNAPYLWGGKTFFGIDCSGFTQIIYRAGGIVIPRDSRQQETIGTTVVTVQEAQTGDLAFFKNIKTGMMHTGILIGDGQLIHASDKVRIDPVDKQGIYNREIKAYTHRLRSVKRLFDRS